MLDLYFNFHILAKILDSKINCLALCVSGFSCHLPEISFIRTPIAKNIGCLPGIGRLHED
jgi:hypothetical protein